MITEVEAIILSRLPYSETSYILNIYTKEEGRLSVFLRNGGKRQPAKMAQLHPLALSHLVLSVSGGMPSVRNHEVSVPLNDLPFNPIKSSIAMFLAEMLSCVLKERCGDEQLFEFLKTNISLLDNTADHLANFHIYILIHLTRFLGFMPNLDGDGSYVDLQEGVLTDRPPFHGWYAEPSVTTAWRQLISNDYPMVSSMPLTREQRQKILESLVRYYQIQVPDMPELKSLSVLQQLFD